jgi:hypothetical protein
MRPPWNKEELGRQLSWNLGTTIHYDLHLTAESPIVRKLAATQVSLPMFSLCVDCERDEPRSLILSLEPAIGHHTLVVFPLAGKLVVFRDAEDVGGRHSPGRNIHATMSS